MKYDDKAQHNTDALHEIEVRLRAATPGVLPAYRNICVITLDNDPRVVLAVGYGETSSEAERAAHDGLRSERPIRVFSFRVGRDDGLVAPLLDEVARLEKEVEHWHAHYDAAQLQWSQALDELVRLRAVEEAARELFIAEVWVIENLQEDDPLLDHLRQALAALDQEEKL